jgi:hypothetical protein
VDALYGELLKAGESVPAIRELLARHEPDDALVVGLLHRAVPLRFLEHLGATPPWCTSGRVLGAIVLHPKTPRRLALKLLPGLFWRDLAEVARTLRVDAGVRARAEAQLKDTLQELRLGERITLGRLATPALLVLLLREAEPKVLRAVLDNARLREEDLLMALRRDSATRVLLEQTAASPKWSERYAVRLALVLQKRTPLALALAQLSSLLEADLQRIANTTELPLLVQAAAQRVAAERKVKGQLSEP